LVGVIVGVLVGVLVGVRVGVLVGVSVRVLVGVTVGVLVRVLVGVRVGVIVGVLVGVIVGVIVGVLVGVSVGVLVGCTMLIAPLTTERPPLATVSVVLLSDLSVASAPPDVVMARLIVPAGQPVRLNTIVPIRSPGAAAAVNGMRPSVSAEE